MVNDSDNFLVWTPTINYVSNKIQENRQLLFIIAPFIKLDALRSLLDQCEDVSALKVIVRWDGSDIINNVSDLEIYEELTRLEIPLYHHPLIHLKILVFNQNWAFHTSGNITRKGLGLANKSNVEIGAQIRLTTTDWIELYRLLEDATRIDDRLYQIACRYREDNSNRTETTPLLVLHSADEKEFSKLSLPAIQSPIDLYKIYQNPERFIDESDTYAAFVHDILLYDIPLNLDSGDFFYRLGESFKDHVFIRAISAFIENEGSVRFGKVNAWITEHCSDKPVPYRSELKLTTNKLYDWLGYFYDEVSWSIPGNHSQVIHWTRQEKT